ncbi:glutaredoxin family protein [Alteribacter natronophilus]|uniref:glutaredoxin family protein n=1 Tax=Alteribacter natronophilus TaxID=2583810 RepID=UPI00110D542D|nr:glutaredoxin family protein [Alteribacter natronophilus]TMW72426.1 glutaredoxin family protein [Alteribacter natronophilus]
MKTTLTFYTKKDCPLCEGGLALLLSLQEEYSFQVEEVDIYRNEADLEKYQIRIPVVEAENGAVLDEGILSTETLKHNLNKLLTI